MAISGGGGCCGWGWNSWGCGWHNNTVVYNHNTYISNSNTFVNRNNYYNRNNANVNNFNRNNVNANNFPDFAYSDNVPEGDLKSNNVVAILDKDDPMMAKFDGEAPVKFNQNFRLYNRDNGQTVYSVSD